MHLVTRSSAVGLALTGALLACVWFCGPAIAQEFDNQLPPRPSTAPLRNQLGTRAPYTPSAPSRPETWPGGVAPGAPANPQAAAAPPGPHSRPLESAQIVAKVGSDVILASDVMYLVLEFLAGNEQAAHFSPEDMERAKAMLARQCLNVVVETKLWVVAARREIPAEKLTELQELTKKSFDLEQLPPKLKKFKVASRSELDAKLRQSGTSIQSMRHGYFERSLASLWRKRQFNEEAEITHEDMLTYYRDHAKDYEVVPRARWEHLMVSFDKFESEDEAYAALAKLGNDLQRGAAWKDLAKVHSHDSSATSGGQHDWTTKDSLVSTVLDQAIFGLPVGQLSRILKDQDGLHIVRVTQREDLRRKAFTDVQKEIKEKIREQRAQQQAEAYAAKLRTEIPVWTIYDNQPQTAQRSAATSPQ